MNNFQIDNHRRGWCPSLFQPMQTGDGWLCRIKPFYSTLTYQQLHFIAQAAEQYGNGFINLSQKGNLQLRGFQENTFQDFIPLAIQHHLCSPTRQQETKRNLLVAPLLALDKASHPETRQLIDILQRTLIENDNIHFPSGKFDILVDGNGIVSFHKETADINIRANQEHWFIQLGNHATLIPCTLQNISMILQDILHFCHTHQIKRLLHQDHAGTYLAQTSYSTQTHPLSNKAELPLGEFALGLHVAIPFGLLTSQDIRILADISQQYGNSELHLTPWRSVILPHCSPQALPHLDHFILDATDPRLKILACPGKPYCIQGQQTILEAIPQLLPAIKQFSHPLHVSGCAKGCAYPRKNHVTLRATAKGYHLILDGKAEDKPVYEDMSLTEIIKYI